LGLCIKKTAALAAVFRRGGKLFYQIETMQNQPNVAVTPPQIPPSEKQLATIDQRLGAWVIDVTIYLAISAIFLIVGGVVSIVIKGGMPSPVSSLVWGAIAIAITIGIQVYPLKSTGQSWGKKVLRIYIVTDNWQKARLAVLLLRYGLYFITLIPLLGWLYFFVDSLMGALTKKRQCLHDFVAKTLVVTDKPIEFINDDLFVS
jgi:uncharacterized RDD family membrane protein YckC